MVADYMPVVYCTGDDVGILLHFVKRAEESGGDVLFFQNVENFHRVAVFITAVERQIHYLFLCNRVERYRVKIFFVKIFLRVFRNIICFAVLCGSERVTYFFSRKSSRIVGIRNREIPFFQRLETRERLVGSRVCALYYFFVFFLCLRDGRTVILFARNFFIRAFFIARREGEKKKNRKR